MKNPDSWSLTGKDIDGPKYFTLMSIVATKRSLLLLITKELSREPSINSQTRLKRLLVLRCRKAFVYHDQKMFSRQATTHHTKL